MSMRNSSRAMPWAGLIALAAALTGAVWLLAGGVSPLGLLNTWYLTRAAGLVAFGLLWLSVVLGLLQSTGYLKGITAPLANIDLHSFASVGACYATLYHALLLLYDRYQPFSPVEILIPFASGYKPFLVGIGVLGFHMAALAVITTTLRAKMAPGTWRVIHQATIAGFFLTLLHGWLMGSDSKLPWVAYGYRFAALSVLALLAVRIYKGVSASAHSVRRG